MKVYITACDDLLTYIIKYPKDVTFCTVEKIVGKVMVHNLEGRQSPWWINTPEFEVALDEAREARAAAMIVGGEVSPIEHNTELYEDDSG